MIPLHSTVLVDGKHSGTVEKRESDETGTRYLVWHRDRDVASWYPERRVAHQMRLADARN